jgi:hypothetical protein
MARRLERNIGKYTAGGNTRAQGLDPWDDFLWPQYRPRPCAYITLQIRYFINLPDPISIAVTSHTAVKRIVNNVR